MKIYVAGIVPRDSLPAALRQTLHALHREIYEAAQLLDLQLSLPKLRVPDEMEPQAFSDWLRSEIAEADAVLTLLVPPSVAVGIEAHLAAECGKPQAILIPPGWPVPRILQALPKVVGIYTHQKTDLHAVMQNLATATMEDSAGAGAGASY